MTNQEALNKLIGIYDKLAEQSRYLAEASQANAELFEGISCYLKWTKEPTVENWFEWLTHAKPVLKTFGRLNATSIDIIVKNTLEQINKTKETYNSALQK